MKKCKDCGHEVSKKAETCPNCGRPLKPKTYGCGTLIVMIGTGLLLYGLFGGDDAPRKTTTTNRPAPKTITPPTQQQKDAVAGIFKSADEPTALGAAWASDRVFMVSVKDDGTSRRGYAMYACEILYENGLKGKGIETQVIDYQKVTTTKTIAILGRYTCL